MKRLRTENVNMFSVLEENKSLRQQLEKTTEKVSHDVLVEVECIEACRDTFFVTTRILQDNRKLRKAIRQLKQRCDDLQVLPPQHSIIMRAIFTFVLESAGAK